MPQDEVLNPYGEERGNAARLEPPRGPGRPIMIQPKVKLVLTLTSLQPAEPTPQPKHFARLSRLAVRSPRQEP